jgi:hypothetical protein
MINTRTHAVIDYVVGLLLIAAPYVLGFANGGPEQWVPQVLGVMTLIVSLITAYELSIAKLIPFRVHLIIDIAQAAVLLLSPWLFGFAERIWWPHVLVAIVEFVVIALSWRSVSTARA